MQKIDAHQHFWIYDPLKDNWITNEMSVIKKDFLPEHLHPLLSDNKFDGCVAVQAAQSETETNFLLELANKNDFIKGVVGWINLQAENLEDRLEHYKQFKKLKGFRHILQTETNRSLMLQPQFTQGIHALQKFSYTYDVLILPDQLRNIEKLVAMFPEQKFVLDHLAKPSIKNKQMADWETDIRCVAKYENVSCKISGLLTEADWNKWSKDDIIPYIEVVANAFGSDKIMFGSDWPVCLLAASYKETYELVKDYFSTYTKQEQDKIFGANAIKFYDLK